MSEDMNCLGKPASGYPSVVSERKGKKYWDEWKKNNPEQYQLTMKLQEKLAEEGFYKGIRDGFPGKGTEAAIKAAKEKHGLDAANGNITDELLGKLGFNTSCPDPKKTGTDKLSLGGESYRPMNFGGFGDDGLYHSEVPLKSRIEAAEANLEAAKGDRTDVLADERSRRIARGQGFVTEAEKKAILKEAQKQGLSGEEKTKFIEREEERLAIGRGYITKKEGDLIIDANQRVEEQKQKLADLKDAEAKERLAKIEAGLPQPTTPTTPQEKAREELSFRLRAGEIIPGFQAQVTSADDIITRKTAELDELKKAGKQDTPDAKRLEGIIANAQSTKDQAVAQLALETENLEQADRLAAELKGKELPKELRTQLAEARKNSPQIETLVAQADPEAVKADKTAKADPEEVVDTKADTTGTVAAKTVKDTAVDTEAEVAEVDPEEVVDTKADTTGTVAAKTVKDTAVDTEAEVAEADPEEVVDTKADTTGTAAKIDPKANTEVDTTAKANKPDPKEAVVTEADPKVLADEPTMDTGGDVVG